MASLSDLVQPRRAPAPDSSLDADQDSAESRASQGFSTVGTLLSDYLGAQYSKGLDASKDLMAASRQAGQALKTSRSFSDYMAKTDTPEARSAIDHTLGLVMGTVNELNMKELPRKMRAIEIGFDPTKTYYHGTKADIEAFDPNALGSSTNAGSAKQGYFFATDPSTASDYAGLSPGRAQLRKAAQENKMMGEFDAFTKQMTEKYGPVEMSFGKGPVKSWKDKASPEELGQYQELVDRFKASAAERDALPSEENLRKLRLEKDSLQDRADTIASRRNNIRQRIELRSKDAASGDEDAKNLLASYKPMLENADAQYAKAEAAYNEAKAAHDAMEGQVTGGRNVIPVHLKMENPYVHDFKGESYRDMSYSDIMKKAKELGHDSVVFKNTFDPADRDNRVMQDIVAVFDPSQIRSKFAAFDPAKKGSGNLSAAIAGATLGGGALLGAGSNNAQAASLPKAGEFRRGFVFMGGDPSDKNSWKRAR